MTTKFVVEITPEVVATVAHAIRDALKRDDQMAYVGTLDHVDERIVIDGLFNVSYVARHVLDVLASQSSGPSTGG